MTRQRQRHDTTRTRSKSCPSACLSVYGYESVYRNRHSTVSTWQYPYCTGAAQTQSKAPHIYTQCSIPQSQAQEQAQRIDQSVNRLCRIRQVYCPSKVQHVTHAKQLARRSAPNLDETSKTTTDDSNIRAESAITASRNPLLLLVPRI